MNNANSTILDPRLSRVGIFAIPVSMLRLKLDVVIGLMSGMVILEARPEIDTGLTWYTAVAPHLFDELTEGHAIPIYDIAERLDGLWEFHRRIT